jgi:Lar family restriction alleviation protein
MTLEMKPCPFCGGAVSLIAAIIGEWSGMWHITCQGCLAQTANKPTRQAAVDAWNMRTDVEALAQTFYIIDGVYINLPHITHVERKGTHGGVVHFDTGKDVPILGRENIARLINLLHARAVREAVHALPHGYSADDANHELLEGEA